MQIDLTQWSDGKVGLSVGIGNAELRTFIARLQELLEDPEQHFHISQMVGGDSAVGDIEIYAVEDGDDNMQVSGHALGGGDDI